VKGSCLRGHFALFCASSRHSDGKKLLTADPGAVLASRLALALLRTSGFSRTGERLLDGRAIVLTVPAGGGAVVEAGTLRPETK
jgi:hypothetical protein